MKTTFKNIIFMGLAFGTLFSTSCNKYLDREALSNITPGDYLNTEADLATYTLSQYSFPTHSGWGIGTFANDNHTDNGFLENGKYLLTVGNTILAISDN